MSSNGSNKTFYIIAIIAIVIIGVVAILQMPDRRTPGEKIGDAVDELSQGVGEAGEQLQNRTVGEKIGDSIGDASRKAAGDE